MKVSIHLMVSTSDGEYISSGGKRLSEPYEAEMRIYVRILVACGSP